MEGSQGVNGCLVYPCIHYGSVRRQIPGLFFILEPYSLLAWFHTEAFRTERILKPYQSERRNALMHLLT